MNKRYIKLNSQGVNQFKQYIQGGATEAPPIHLLEQSATVDQTLMPNLSEEVRTQFENRMALGKYLADHMLKGIPQESIIRDEGLWSGLALLWFDQLCPVARGGTRVVKEMARYILSDSYRNYYRHLVWSPWFLYSQHKDKSGILLMSSRQGDNSLSANSDIHEHIAGRQHLAGNRAVVELAHELYWDEVTNRPRKGATGNGRGSVRRLGAVLRQFELTYDISSMNKIEIRELLPKEFTDKVFG